jgi:hypothetical protein
MKKTEMRAAFPARSMRNLSRRERIVRAYRWRDACPTVRLDRIPVGHAMIAEYLHEAIAPRGYRPLPIFETTDRTLTANPIAPNSWTREVIGLAQEESARTCEYCGRRGGHLRHLRSGQRVRLCRWHALAASLAGFIDTSIPEPACSGPGADRYGAAFESMGTDHTAFTELDRRRRLLADIEAMPEAEAPRDPWADMPEAPGSKDDDA